MSKIALGTAQFGMDYARNQKSDFSTDEVIELMDFAVSQGINVFDSSMYYGNSDNLIGDFIKSKRPKIKVITKINGGENKGNIRDQLLISLESLNSTSIYGYMIHNYHSFLDHPEVWEKLTKLRSEKLVQKIGFSLYYPEELQSLWEKEIYPDIVQVPYNIFDRRFEALFPQIQEKKCEIHVRSTFAAGLVFRKSVTENEYADMFSLIEMLNQISNKYDISIESLCINFALQNQYIDQIILGVETKENIKSNLLSVDQYIQVKDVIKKLDVFKIKDISFLLPTDENYKNYSLLKK